MLVNYPFSERIFPGAFDVIQHLAQWGTTVILTDGDVVFQPLKIERSGLAEAVGGRVLLYVHKERELAEVERRFPADAIRARGRQDPDPHRREGRRGGRA